MQPTNATALLILVGAGPGDPELITVKALREIKNADVILYDSLVNPQIFNLAFDEDIDASITKLPELIFVGKRMGHKSIKQEDINNLILDRLKAGQRVLRLKGGDPFIFARGVEELEVAKKHGYDYQVIPGLTSGLAAPVARAITLTRRGQSDSVTLVTGHEINEAKLAIWAKIIKTGAALVVYMGLSNVVEIIAGLQRELDLDLPALAIHNGTLVDEKIVISTLQNLAQDMINHGIKSPAILVFGKFINPEFKLDTFDELVKFTGDEALEEVWPVH